MPLRIHPVRSLRRVMTEIEYAVNASAALSDAARRRQTAAERGETPANRALDF